MFMEVDKFDAFCDSLTWDNQLKLYQLVCLSFELLRLNSLLRSIGLRCCIAVIFWNEDKTFSSFTVEQKVKIMLFI